MRKLIIMFLFLLTLPATSTVYVNLEKEKISTEEFMIVGQEDEHIVLAELGTTTWCPYCAKASELLYSLYSSGELPFYYISLVYDKSDDAKKRGVWLNDYFVPMLYLDGGYEVVDTATEISYTNKILATSDREVHDVELDVQAEWNGNNIYISVNITNNECGIPNLFHNSNNHLLPNSKTLSGESFL